MNKTKVLFLAVLVCFFVSLAGAASLGPEPKTWFSYADTDTVTERLNVSEYNTTTYNKTLENGTVITKENKTFAGWHWEEGMNEYIFDIEGPWINSKTEKDSGDFKEIEVTIQLEPNWLTKAVKGNKEPFKSYWKNNTITELVNDHYYWNHSNFTKSKLEELDNELSNLPIYENGDLVKTSNLKDKPKNITAKIKNDGTGFREIRIGNNTIVVSASSQTNWNKGQFNGTSADREDNGGVLGIGTRNGTVSGKRGLIGYWRFDATSDPVTGNGFEIKDYSGAGHNASWDDNNDDGDERGFVGTFGTNAFDFSGGDDIVEIADGDEGRDLGQIEDIGKGSDWTISAWCKEEGGDGNFEDCIRSDETGEDGNRYIVTFRYTGSDDFECELNDLSNSATVTDTSNPEDGSWQFFVCTHDASTTSMTLYRDGHEVGTADTSSLNSDTADGGWWIGGLDRSNNNVGSFNGLIDEPRIYNRTFNHEEVNRTLFHYGGDGEFDGEYNRTQINIPSNEAPTQLSVDSENVTTTGNTTHFKLETNNGETDVVKLDSGDVNKNYSLDFSNTGGLLNVTANLTASTPKWSPVINSYSVRTASSDSTPPIWQNLKNNITGTVSQGSAVNISAEFRDNGSGLTEIFLSTNATGTFSNYSSYDSRGLKFERLNKTKGPFTDKTDIGWSKNGKTLTILKASTTLFQNKLIRANVLDPFNISSIGKRVRVNISVTPAGLAWEDNGDKLYMTDVSSTNEVVQYTASDSYNISTITRDLSYSLNGFTARDVEWNNKGTRFYVVFDDASNAKIESFDVSSKYDLSSTVSSNDTLFLENKSYRSITFDEKGKRMHLVVEGSGETDSTVRQYRLSQAFNISSATLETTVAISGASGNDAVGFDWNDNGDKAYIANHDDDNDNLRIKQFDSRLYKSPNVKNSVANKFVSSGFNWRNSIFSQTLGYKVWGVDNEDNWNVTDTGQIYMDALPTVDKLKFRFQNVEGSQNQIFEARHNDVEGFLSGRSPVPQGTVELFNNNSLNVSGLSDTFDYNYFVNDTLGEFSSTIGANATFNTVHIYNESNSGIINETEQLINSTGCVNVRGNTSDVEIGFNQPDYLLSTDTDGNTTITKASGSTCSTSKYRVDYINTTIYNEFEDTKVSHNLSTQGTAQIKQVESIRPTAFDNLNITAPPINGTCQNFCNTRITSVAKNGANNETANATGDFLTETIHTPKPEPKTVVLHRKNYQAKRPIQTNNSQIHGFTDVDASSVSIPTWCTLQNTTISPGPGLTNSSQGLQCIQGDRGNPVETEFDNFDGDFAKVWYNSTDMNITSNITSSKQIRIDADEDNFVNDPNDRNAGSLNAFVNNKSADGNSQLNVTDAGENLTITVGEAFQSSLKTNDDNWAIYFTVGSKTEGSGGGGGGGGGGEEETTARMTFNNNYTIPPETTRRTGFKIANLVEQDNTIIVQKESGGGCSTIKFQATADKREDFVDSATYTIPPASEGLSGDVNEINLVMKVSVPPERQLNTFANENGILVCDLEVDSSTGAVNGDLTIKIDPSFERNVFQEVLQFVSDTFAGGRPLTAGFEVTLPNGNKLDLVRPTGAGFFVLAVLGGLALAFINRETINNRLGG